MATIEILAAFALSAAFMLFLWSLKDLLLRPRRMEKPLGLALLITERDDERPEQAAAPERAADCQKSVEHFDRGE